MENEEFIGTPENDFEKVEVAGKGDLNKDVKSASVVSTCKSCSFLNNLDPKVLDLIYWRCPKKSGIVLSILLTFLISLSCCSVISICAYISLATLSVTFSYRIYRSVMAAVQKANEPNPFQEYLDLDLELSKERVRDFADSLLKQFVQIADCLRKLFLINDYLDSLKFVLLLWIMTYIGSWFNFLTVLIISVVCLFTLPKVYDMNHVQIDKHVETVQVKFQEILKIVQSKLSFLGKNKKKDE